MNDNLKRFCPACQRLDKLDRIWFSSLPAICTYCADCHINEAELQLGGPTGVERAIEQNEAVWQHIQEQRAEEEAA